MKTTIKRWSSLGLGLAITSGTLAACEPNSVEETQPTVQPETIKPIAQDDLSQLSQGGEGEGGVDISAALTDPIVFNTSLAITEAHIIAARDAYKLGKNDAAAEMFAHPVSEVLADMADVFASRKVDDFSELLIEASTSVLNDEGEDAVNAKADAIIERLRNAATKAPKNGTSPIDITIGVIIDQLERAADMYKVAKEFGEYGPYLDGYGFYKTGANAYQSTAEQLATQNTAVAISIEETLHLLRDAYPDAAMPETLDVEPAILISSVSNIQLSATR